MGNHRADLHRRLDHLLDLVEEITSGDRPGEQEEAAHLGKAYTAAIDLLRDAAGPIVAETLLRAGRGAEPGKAPQIR